MTTTTKTKTKPIKELPPNPFQHEILELASKQRTASARVEVLKKYRNEGLVTILIWNFDPSIQSVLPPGDVPYADTEDQTSVGGNLTELIQSKVKNDGVKTTGYFGTEDFANEKLKTSIRQEWKNFYNFVVGGNGGISQLRKETMFINILQGLHPLEAELLCLVKDKRLTDKYKITFENVRQAFPDVQWGGRA
jgi:hypothetical protein